MSKMILTIFKIWVASSQEHTILMTRSTHKSVFSHQCHKLSVCSHRSRQFFMSTYILQDAGKLQIIINLIQCKLTDYRSERN